MVSTSNPWHLLHEQLMNIEETYFPSAPVEKAKSSMINVRQDRHWIEFDTDFLLDEDEQGSILTIDSINRAIVIVRLCKENSILRLYDVILSINEIDLKNFPKNKAQCLLDAHQGKRVFMRLRRLQPSNVEMIEYNIRRGSTSLGFTVDGGTDEKKGKFEDFGIFVVGIRSKSRAATQGRLRIGDRLLTISNSCATVNLQCLKLDEALKWISRLKKESSTIKLLVAHPAEN